MNGTVLEETCGILYAGDGDTVVDPGDLTLRAFRGVLPDGFSVGTGGSLTVETR